MFGRWWYSFSHLFTTPSSLPLGRLGGTETGTNSPTHCSCSSVKASLSEEWGLDTIFLGTADTFFLSFYSVGLLWAGYVGDKYSAKSTLTVYCNSF